MIPIGYMAKRIAACPDWLTAPHVVDVLSVSDCISKNFADYIPYWKHNGYWYFDTPKTILEVARENEIDLAGTRLFFYEAHELEFDDDECEWQSFALEHSFVTNVMIPAKREVEGYDVCCWGGAGPEHSPLSCNGLASQLDTNEHCLLKSVDDARALLNAGRFGNSEPGPFRIISVSSVLWPGQKGTNKPVDPA